jgi:hypothetical protein
MRTLGFSEDQIIQLEAAGEAEQAGQLTTGADDGEDEEEAEDLYFLNTYGVSAEVEYSAKLSMFWESLPPLGRTEGESMTDERFTQ